MMHEPADSLNLSAIALFPLPNVVLFPRAVLPLHVFEFRYRLMTAEVLQGAGLIAMALLKPGWEKQYHDRPAIEPVVCVGQILRYEELDDGKYNLLLQGVLRATIDREYADRPYRYASMNRLPEKSAPESDLIRQRARLLELFSAPPLEGLPISSGFRVHPKSASCSPARLPRLRLQISSRSISSNLWPPSRPCCRRAMCGHGCNWCSM